MDPADAYSCTWPVEFRLTGQVQEYSQEHDCGEWLGVCWRVLHDDATLAEIIGVIEQLAADFSDALAEGEEEARAELRKMVAEARAELDAGADPEDVLSQGDETLYPGVYQHPDGRLYAWTHGHCEGEYLEKVEARGTAEIVDQFSGPSATPPRP